MSTSQQISQSTDTKVVIACLAVSTLFIALRAVARWAKIRRAPFAAEDLAAYVALASFATMCALYLAIMQTYYSLIEVLAGTKPPYASLEADASAMLREFLAVQFFFWLTLWAVKGSLLFTYKILTVGLPLETKIWWAVMGFTILTYIGCCITQFTSCTSIHAWLTPNACTGPRDVLGKAVALYFSLGADLLTDMLVMAVPIRLLWNLRITTSEKAGLCVIFTVGILTMIAAIVRVISLGSGTEGGQVNTTWLILWAAVEGTVAIIVCCLPSFIILVRGRARAMRSTNYMNQHSTSNTRHYSKPSSAATRSRIRSESILLDEVGQSRDIHDMGSKNDLVPNSIVVTRDWKQTWHSNDEQSVRTGV